MSKTSSLLRVLLAYVVALGVFALWLGLGPRSGRLWLDGLFADLMATGVIFVASRIHHNSSFYDPYWTVLPPVLCVGWWLRADAPGDDVRAWLVLAVIVIWAVRLTWNWTLTFPDLSHEDWRYPMLRDKAVGFEFVVDLIAIHVVPTVQVFVGMLPVYVVLTHRDRPLGWLDLVAFGLGLGAVTLELIADLQMRRFAAAKQPGSVMDRGVWSWSRHPNYFGEFCFWVAVGLFGVAVAPDQWWWMFAGSALMLAMFHGASIPMMERRSRERRPAYGDVIARVARFVPRPPRKPSA